MNTDLSDPFSWPQLVGYGATLFGVAGFLQKNDNRLRIYITIMSMFLIAHFVLMGSYTAGLSALIASSRWSLTMVPWVKARGYIFVPFYVFVFLLSAFLTYEHWYDFLPAIASIVGTFALFYLHGLKMRLLLLCGGTFWLVHNILAMSYGPALMECFVLTANSIMIIRMAIAQRRVPEEVKGNSFSRFG